MDVAIVGGGLTGLWTAYYLLEHRPDLAVLVLEAEHVGFGASGRNGGWVSALWPVSPETVAATHGRPATVRLFAELRDTVDEVGSRCAAEGIEAGFVRGGRLALVRSRAQEHRARAAVEQSQRWGLGTIWLDREAARERLAAQGVAGATFNPHCARVHPRRLVDGLAAAVTRRAGLIREVGASHASLAGASCSGTDGGSAPGMFCAPPRPGRRRCPATNGISRPSTRSWSPPSP